jgi:hypothetical protein
MAIRYYNGIKFDSKIELKFALSIESNFAYLHHPKKIFESYYREDGKIVEINNNTRNYTPDFLIRSVSRNVATIVETKPDDYNDPEQFERRNRIVAKYLSSIETELDFKWVYERDIELTVAQCAKLEHVLQTQDKEKRFYYLLKKIYRRNGRVPFVQSPKWTEKEYVAFVKYGTYPESMVANEVMNEAGVSY